MLHTAVLDLAGLGPTHTGLLIAGWVAVSMTTAKAARRTAFGDRYPSLLFCARLKKAVSLSFRNNVGHPRLPSFRFV